jgi:hypothetical protein
MTLQLLAPFVLADQAVIDWKAAAYPTAQVTLGGNRTFGAPVPLEAGSTFMLYVIQDATGSRLITWNAIFKWPGGTAPALSTAANAIDIIAFVTDGTNMYGVPQTGFA